MTAMIRIPCRALEPYKLLAFLALLGSMRALRVARPAWSAKSWWEGSDPRPLLEVRGTDDDREVAAALLEGLRHHREPFQFEGHKDPDYTQEEYRRLIEDARSRWHSEPLRLDAVSALGCDLIADEQKGTIRPTPYCLMFGQGHQHFLKNWSAAPRSDAVDPRTLLAALTEPWPYNESGLTFRWDPDEDRRYALRASDPSGDPPRTSVAANRLAALAIASLPAVPAGRWLGAPGFAREGRRALFRWPIWTVPLTESSIVTLLRHPYILDGRGMRPAGVAGVMAAERRSVGKFLVVGQARLST